ncbi:MAG: DUF5665 domain-containing protein [Pseudoruegeria sp.]
MSTDPQTEMNDELLRIRKELETFNNHRIVRINNNMWRTLLFQFARGMAVGLGTVVGATVLVSVAVYSLSKIDFIPIIGDWATEIAAEIQGGDDPEAAAPAPVEQ